MVENNFGKSQCVKDKGPKILPNLHSTYRILWITVRDTIYFFSFFGRDCIQNRTLFEKGHYYSLNNFGLGLI